MLLASFGEQAELEKQVQSAERAAHNPDFDPDRSIIVTPLNSATVAGRLVAIIPRRAGNDDKVVAAIVAMAVGSGCSGLVRVVARADVAVNPGESADRA